MRQERSTLSQPSPAIGIDVTPRRRQIRYHQPRRPLCRQSSGRITMLSKRALLAGLAATGVGTSFGLATDRPALTQLWGQQIVVENKPGGGGIIGTRAALGEQPDGHTLFAALASIYMILPAQNENLPFDVNKDMIPIGLTAYEGLVMACSPKLGVK